MVHNSNTRLVLTVPHTTRTKGGQQQIKITKGKITMNVRLYDGTVRCADCFDSSTYESETQEPCLYCGSTPTTNTNNADNPMRPEFRLHTVKVSLAKEQCSWCYRPALYSIECASWVDLACSAHQQEWFPFKSIMEEV